MYGVDHKDLEQIARKLIRSRDLPIGKVIWHGKGTYLDGATHDAGIVITVGTDLREWNDRGVPHEELPVIKDLRDLGLHTLYNIFVVFDLVHSKANIHILPYHLIDGKLHESHPLEPFKVDFDNPLLDPHHPAPVHLDKK